MSYTVETKKRKFDRILEALTDGAASPSRTTPTSHQNASVPSSARDTASESSKRRRTALSSMSIMPNPSVTSLSGHYLPSSRTAFLQRLETFRHVTQWHVPSTEPVNASIWAKRGWTCVDTDTVSCGSCKERVHVDLDVDGEQLRVHETDGQDEEGSADEDAFAMAAAVHDSMVKRYQDMIITAHTERCPWRSRGCDSSVQRIEGLLNTNTAISGLRTRYNSIITRSEEVPEVASLPTGSNFAVDALEMELFRFGERDTPDGHALRLAVCGWERKGEDIIECRHCFRSLGLWLYRGENPVIESLDGVDNHLEYCPWRSAEAQDTEVVVDAGKTNVESVPRIRRVAGWALMYQAVVRDNTKKRGTRPTASISTSEADTGTSNNESLTSAQRERKMRDLFRRIKEIKKPFNVKSLLQRKANSKT